MVFGSNLFTHEHKTMDELVESCVNYYEKNIKKVDHERVRKRRSELAFYIEKFHKECGTLTFEVQKKLSILKDRDCLLVMSAHQPNLFAYSGVMRKITLLSALSENLEKRLGVPVGPGLGGDHAGEVGLQRHGLDCAADLDADVRARLRRWLRRGKPGSRLIGLDGQRQRDQCDDGESHPHGQG